MMKKHMHACIRIKKTNNTKCWDTYGERRTSYITSANIKQQSHLENSFSEREIQFHQATQQFLQVGTYPRQIKIYVHTKTYT
jgi:hypothetical protein